jgi:Alw26I/Eco31I/Esp3I family type II restriction endonuclease
MPKKATTTSSKNSRENHVDFIAYQEFIVSNSNYKGLFFKRKADNSIVWVAPKVTADGKNRDIWWQNKAQSLGIEIKAGFYVKTAVQIHPTKWHTCQICGRSLRIEYTYPNNNTIKQINTVFGIAITPFDKDIFEIINGNLSELDKWKDIFKLEKNASIINYENLKEWVQQHQVDKSSKSFLSPGVMSNAPDRYDGFHSDGNCCRSKSDKGRHKTNMQRYGQDRRAYENWADGDWKQADRLMSMFRKFGFSADHIGPISLGFCHRPKFHALTKEENSSKNNRMSFDDVQVLIADENNGEQVVSWHSKPVWDCLKNKVKDDSDALALSKLMRRNLHWVLTIFSKIEENSFSAFLETFLNLEYSDFDYEFPDFTPDNIGKIVQIAKKGKNQANNKARYIRIAFESLEEYKTKENRRVDLWKTKSVDKAIAEVFDLLRKDNKAVAKQELLNIFKLLADELANNWEIAKALD